MSYVPPRTRDKDHYFVNTNSFNEDNDISWKDGPIAILKHKINNVKLYIDASDDDEAKAWRSSIIKYNRIQILNNQLIALSTYINNYAHYFNGNSNVRSKLEFSNSGRFITYKNNTWEPRRTLTKFNGSEKSDLPEDYKSRFEEYRYDKRVLDFKILKFSQWGSADILSITITESSDKFKQIHDVFNIEIETKDTNNEGIEAAPVYLKCVNNKEIDILYTDGSHSLTDVNGKAIVQIIPRQQGKIQLVASINFPSEKDSPNFEVLCIDDETEIYIRGASYQTQNFINNPVVFYQKVITVLENIENLIWEEIGINQSHNVNSDNQLSEDIVIFLKKARYNGAEYMSDTVSNSLRTEIISKLNNDFDIGFTDVEIRSSRKFINI